MGSLHCKKCAWGLLQADIVKSLLLWLMAFPWTWTESGAEGTNQTQSVRHRCGAGSPLASILG